MKHKTMMTGGLLLAAAAAMAPAQASSLGCTMKYTLSGWSAFYKTASGSGTVTCSDGSTMNVKLSSKGGGLTLGKATIDNGRGEFSGVQNIRDVLGDYAQGGAHGGAGDAAGVMGLTKGEVSLSLKGEGRGVDAGIDFGKFTISEVPAPPPVPVSTTADPQPQ
jgi:hypothetical protein